nr:MAG TPA: hypothetical protein [Caudoviricetes sp.]
MLDVVGYVQLTSFQEQCLDYCCVPQRSPPFRNRIYYSTTNSPGSRVVVSIVFCLQKVDKDDFLYPI